MKSKWTEKNIPFFFSNFQMFWVVKWLFTQNLRHFSSIISIRTKILGIKFTETSGESFIFSHLIHIAPSQRPAIGKERNWVKRFGRIVQIHHHHWKTTQTRGWMISPPCVKASNLLLSSLIFLDLPLFFCLKKCWYLIFLRILFVFFLFN